MITGDDRWWNLASQVVTAVYDELTVKPARYGVVPGAIAWDECDCGLLAVTWALAFPSDVFPTEQTQVTGSCLAAWEVVEFAVQVIRCAPGPGPDATSPSVGDLSDAARLQDFDSNQTTRAVGRLLCELKDQMEISDFIIGRRTPQGPEGMCVGIEQRFQVALSRLAPATV